ncbi:helix-turn-helix transcriptional regulator [Candidatus Pacearchaeota archaeon]|nr:helix-turn-helix transcriptional regulator [Candidatus Pacearchaeota archaeon]
MDYLEIKKALNDQGLNWTEAAKAIGCSQSHLCNIARGRTYGKRVASALALLIGKSITEVFPKIKSFKENPKIASQNRIELARQKIEKQVALG